MLIKLESLFKKIRVIDEKTDAKGHVTQPQQVEITFTADFNQITDAEFANLTLAQAHQTLTDVTMDPKQFVMDIHNNIKHNSITPAEE